MALAVSQSEQETQGKRASPLEPPNRVVPRVNLAYMQDKRRRNDFASTEVGEVKGGRVTQQAFEVADKKDSGIRNSAMPGTRGDERKDAHDNPAPRKRACPRFLPRSFDFKKGHGEKPGKQGITQAQRLKIFSSHHPPWHRQAKSRTAKRARQRHVTQIGSVFSSKVSVIRNAAAQRGLE